MSSLQRCLPPEIISVASDVWHRNFQRALCHNPQGMIHWHCIFTKKTRAAGGHLAVLFLCGTPPLAELKGRGEEMKTANNGADIPESIELDIGPEDGNFGH